MISLANPPRERISEQSKKMSMLVEMPHLDPTEFPMQIAKLSRDLMVTAAALAAWLSSTCAYGGVTFTSLVSFNGSNGANPSAELAWAADGSFFGTTTSGGAYGYGTVFRLTTNGTLVPLVSFGNINGATPFGRLSLGTDGLFYGTTSGGGTNGYGTVFKMTTNGVLTPLVSFNNTNGARPHAGLTQGNDGNFYGTTAFGGTNGAGAVFRLATNGAFVCLVSFDTNAYTPYAGLMLGSNGVLYGTTFLGGTNSNGTVFQLSTTGTLTPAHGFNGANDGGNPYASLIQGADGQLYGTAFYGGTSGFGTAFRLTPANAFFPLVSFNGTNGAYPQAPLLQAADGNFYGTTQNGGAYTNQFGTGYGTVFQLTAGGMLTTLFSFNGTNGAFPRAGLAQGPDGSLYGTTTYGGTNDNGTVFRVTVTAPPPPPALQAAVRTGNTLVLTWSAITGQVYRIFSETNLDQPNWSPLGSPINATNSIMTTLETVGQDPQRFYRVALLP